jgi:hypothetical protein
MLVEAIPRKGPRVIFSLAELDPAFRNSNVIIADTLNGATLDQKTGLVLIAGSDKTSLRSIKDLIAIRARRLG